MKTTRILLLLLFLGTFAQAQQGKTVRVLMVGGGSSHDYQRWYAQEDAALLEEEGLAEVTYTERIDSILSYLPESQVLFLTNNQPINDPAVRKAILDFVNEGKGLILAHAATWYNWADWPEYNRQLVGGGSKAHDPYGPFVVEIKAKHPVTRKVPKSFSLEDELYQMVTDTSGPGQEILAIGRAGDKSYPVLWVTPHPKARILGLTLGHDGKSHQLAEYRQLLRNALKWVAGK